MAVYDRLMMLEDLTTLVNRPSQQWRGRQNLPLAMEYVLQALVHLYDHHFDTFAA